MAHSILFLLLILLLLLDSSDASHSLSAAGTERRMMGETMETSNNISLVCQATQFPDVCYSSLEMDPRAVRAKHSQELVGLSITIAYQGVNESDGFADHLIQVSASDVNVNAIAHDCKELLSSSKYWLQACISSDLDRQVDDMQQWLAGVLTYQNDCTAALSNLKSTKFIKKMIHKLDSVARLISNALSMVDAFASYGANPLHWKPPNTHRKFHSSSSSQFPQWLSNGDRNLLQSPPKSLLPSAVVIPPPAPSKPATATAALHSTAAAAAAARTSTKARLTVFHSIQDAVDHAPSHCMARYVILIKAGMYNETVRIPQTKTMLMFLGEGSDKTIISGNMNVAKAGITTFASATLAVNGKGFLARDLTVQNVAGPEGHQAVALRVDSDLSAFHGCSILGYQDTLYTHTFRQFYRDCRIEGTIDFIFGNSAAVFQNCILRVRPGNPGVILSTVTAQGRLDPAQPTGLVFQNCTINGTEEFMRGFNAEPRRHLAYLGRPWKLYSRTIFLHSYMESLVRPEGWLPWDGTFALNTLYFAEYLSCGPGASFFGRVSWSTQLSIADALAFTVQSFIQGDSWLPSTNIPFSHSL